MAYALQPLLKIRTMREDRASGELVAAKRKLAIAEEALDERRRDYAEWESTKEARRDRIYDAIIGREVSRDQLDLANEGVTRIDEEGTLKADNVKRAEGEVREKALAADAARANLVTATKNRTKTGLSASLSKNGKRIAECRAEIRVLPPTRITLFTDIIQNSFVKLDIVFARYEKIFGKRQKNFGF